MDWEDLPEDLPKKGDHSLPADGTAPEWLEDYFGDQMSTRFFEDIPNDAAHNVTVISEKDSNGRHMASTVSAKEYLNRLRSA